ncbi:PREDICTED: histone-lysine N-methyltransferase SETMAR-like [Polistes canadensis]|uniref:histone-lysine N-methyltransferase SETMAR-like n=1 Tax=Polistes canadensis TaxID=91411 RepID=UPI000718E405|nr:PREDICTED: histone-lysine N-methyltransferase SETMAR-like [Polistes canadensis]
MECKNEHFRNILLYYFRKGKNARQAAKKIRDVYDDEALKERQCQNWFKKFRSEDFYLKDDKRLGRPVKPTEDEIKTIIETDRHITTQEIAEKVNVSHTTIENHLKRFRLVKKLDIWVPHDLKEIHLTQRINVCDLLLRRNEFDPFLKRIITGDEKLIVYHNVNRKRSWCTLNESSQATSKAQRSKKRKFFCQFGGMGKVRCFLSCFQGTKPLIRRSTVGNWIN